MSTYIIDNWLVRAESVEAAAEVLARAIKVSLGACLELTVSTWDGLTRTVWVTNGGRLFASTVGPCFMPAEGSFFIP